MAVDIHAAKLKRLQKNCRRLGLTNIQTFCSDLTGFSPSQQFDRILLDAPCSGLGVLRKHPEAKWMRREEDIEALQQLQLRLLMYAASLLRPGGVLVYSTCTTEPEENEDVITQLLDVTADFRVGSVRPYLPAELQTCATPEGLLRILPPQPYFDGFFCARLIRS